MESLSSVFLQKLSEGLTPAEKLPLKEYLKKVWRIPQPNPLLHNWHMDAICEHLEAVFPKRDIRNLIIAMPPRMAKSMTVSVIWPTWIWSFAPHIQFIFSSYSRELSTRDSMACRAVIQSDYYQQHWGGVFSLSDDENRKTAYRNSKGGYRFSTSVGGVGTGLGGNIVCVDDAHNVKEAPSAAKRQQAILWWTQAMSTRLNNPKEDSRVIVMQRVHMDDLAGYILENTPENWEYLILPNEFDPKRQHSTAIGWRDPRTKKGELLFPERFGPEETRAMKKELGPTAYNAQYQQEPSDPEGSLFLRRWWRFYTNADLHRGPKGNLIFDEVVQSWDMAFKDTDTSAFVVGQVWGRRGANKFLLDQVRDRYSFTATVDAVRNLTAKWPMTNAVYVEDKANGTAVIDSLRNEIAGIIAVNPEGGKVARAHAIQPQMQAGNVYLPSPANCPWVNDYIEEFSNATPEGGGKFWDQIDATTQALVKLHRPPRKATWGRTSTGMATGGRRLTFGR